MTSVRHLRLRASLLSATLVALVIGAVGWYLHHEQPPVRVGFLGGISGRVADLGMAGRDGAILAVEERNAAGGIGGRRIELLVQDDRQDPEAARNGMAALVEQGVVAIVGPMTSAMAVVAAPLADGARIPIISPSASTTTLTGRDDYFFRVYPDSSQETPQLARIATEKLGLRSVVIVTDRANAEYTLNWSGWFAREFAARGGTVAAEIQFTSSPGLNVTELAQSVLATPADALLLLTNSIDTALLVQKVRQLGSTAQILVSEWSTTEELLRLGGQAVNGILFLHTFNPRHSSPQYVRFRDAFERRFGYSVGFPAIKGYDAMQMLFLALERRQGEDIKQALGQVEGFEGLQNHYRIDRFGDVHQQGFVMTIRNGAFVPAE